MSVLSLFPTLVYSARISNSVASSLNQRLLRECRQLAHDDESGRRWSKKNYPGGYTSYNSAAQMHRLSPTFAELERKLNRHVAKFARALHLDLSGRELSMTDCWANIMPRGVAHSWHLHPLSTLSGTYYVRTTRESPGLKLEDPRLDRFMGAPPRKSQAPRALQPWVTIPADAGTVVLFESWLRHEVPPNQAAGERVSISFNYGWF